MNKEKTMNERIKLIYERSKLPLTDDVKTKRVEIIVLKFKEPPEIIDECISRIIHNTDWPFKLVIFDNRLNPENTSKIWNKLIRESTCDYVCIIDSDAYVPKKKSQEEKCWVTRMMESIDETGIVVPVGNVDGVGGCNRATAAAKYPSFSKANGVWSGYCFLLKKSVLLKTKMFNETFNVYGQDSEFAFRAHKIVGTIMRTDTFVRHLGGSSFKKAATEGSFDREADKLFAQTLYRKLTH